MRRMLIVFGILSVLIPVACLCNSFARIHQVNSELVYHSSESQLFFEAHNTDIYSPVILPLY
jgi:hypothetical protein